MKSAQAVNLKDLLKFIHYDACAGTFYCLSKSNPPRPERQLIPDEENRIITTIHGAKLKIKADRLAWFISTGKQPARFQVVFHKNMDSLDNRFHNLILLQKKEYLQLIESMKNISGDLKLIPHNTDMFSYILCYKHNGRIRKEVIQDISVARRKFTKLQLKYVKLISKYTLSD